MLLRRLEHEPHCGESWESGLLSGTGSGDGFPGSFSDSPEHGQPCGTPGILTTALLTPRNFRLKDGV